MGFEVVGTAQSGEEAIKIIKKTRPHVVLTDIRMKQITGLMVMEEIQKEDIGCLFIVLSAYRDFEYAQTACELGAFAYLLKPIEEEKLQETMQGAYRICMEQIRKEARYESWEKLLLKDGTSFLEVVVQKYVHNRIPETKVREVFSALDGVMEEGDRFITVCVDIDLAYKITNPLEYEAARFTVLRFLEESIKEKYFCWSFEDEEGCHVFIIKTKDNASVREMKHILEHMEKEERVRQWRQFQSRIRELAESGKAMRRAGAYLILHVNQAPVHLPSQRKWTGGWRRHTLLKQRRWL